MAGEMPVADGKAGSTCNTTNHRGTFWSSSACGGFSRPAVLVPQAGAATTWDSTAQHHPLPPTSSVVATCPCKVRSSCYLSPPP
ncbi:hypothetical protein VPH35_120927 [Triticum aestivum]